MGLDEKRALSRHAGQCGDVWAAAGGRATGGWDGVPGASAEDTNRFLLLSLVHLLYCVCPVTKFIQKEAVMDDFCLGTLDSL